MGTVTYMSPERIRGAPYGVSSDVWSLGLTLLEAATGRFPYPSAGVRNASMHVSSDRGPCTGHDLSYGAEALFC